ncbi:hypothetical protein TWF506_008394 [Arthrobotrys conoides]|uniref:F-box domain-containing protein n=1 Tax=Arthrobotrys conoides TaxID=74498 RepID=A0AAN8RS19_9PEZI
MDRTLANHNQYSPPTMATVTKPPASLTALAPELIYTILENLSFRDLYHLLQTCKYLYSLTFPHIWTAWDINGTYMERHKPGVILVGDLWRLIRLSENYKSDLKTGWEYLKTIIMEDLHTCNTHSDLIELLGREVQEGRLKLKKAAFNICCSNHTSCIGKLFQILKAYSEHRSSKDFSMSLIAYDSLLSSQMLALISLNNLTIVTLYTSYIQDSTFYLRNIITGLKNLLSQAIQLEKLSLPISRFDDPEDFKPWPIGACRRELNDLNEAFQKHQKLRELHFGGVFLHPSFFVIPPPGVRVLEYKCYTTPAWWVEFSKCSFEGVEELTLGCVNAKKWWQRADYESFSGISWAGNGSFELDDIAVTGLKKFKKTPPPSSGRWKVKRTPRSIGPTNLVRLIVEKNRGLEG